MKWTLLLTVIICLLASMVPLSAQEADVPGQSVSSVAIRPAPVNAQPRFADARRVIRQEGGRVKEVGGLLVLDPGPKELRFEVDGQASFAVAYDRITAMHYEMANEASKWGWPLKDTKYYVTIHYADADRRTWFETVCVDKDDVPPALDMLEAGTGIRIERTNARRSFLGIPIRAAIGDRVTVTDRTGQATEGTITALSASSLALDVWAGTRAFDRESVSRIRLTRSRGRDVRKEFGTGFAIGAVAGGIAGGWVARAFGGSIVDAFQGAAVIGGMTGAIGALAAAASPSYRFRTTREVYLDGTAGASKAATITVVPQATREGKGVAVAVRF